MNLSNLAYDAMMFARQMHAGQVRKYTGNPYVDHLAEVAGIVSTVTVTGAYARNRASLLAVAWLHDTIEDTDTPYDILATRFGGLVAEGVYLLSDLEEGTRKQRKAASRLRLAASPGWVQTIKCADLISNTSSIVQHDPKFAVTYLEEKRLLLDVLTKADGRLRDLAYKQADKSNLE